jgi:hypothetical protein
MNWTDRSARLSLGASAPSDGTGVELVSSHTTKLIAPVGVSVGSPATDADSDTVIRSTRNPKRPALRPSGARSRLAPRAVPSSAPAGREPHGSPRPLAGSRGELRL